MAREERKRRPAKAAKSRKQAGQDHVDDDSIVAPEVAEPKPELAPKTPHELLLPQHRKLVEESGITPEVAIARGYTSLTKKVQVKSLGFADSQCLVPALHCPIWGVWGKVVNHQIRPDTPRILKGKAIKYETPKGSNMVIDVPPSTRARLGDPCSPLFITEGVRKADSAASRGITCISLLGVCNWRGTNGEGGKTALADWEAIALNGRDVYIAFDSDVTVKLPVRIALGRLAAFLKARGANVSIIHLPNGPGGTKIGLDDFLANGRDLADLLALAHPEVPPQAADSDGGDVVETQYRAHKAGLVRIEYDEESGEVRHLLTNFTSQITAEIVEDDGVTTTRRFELQVRQGDAVKTIEVPAGTFSNMNWATELCGSTHTVCAGFGNRDHARAAIQHLSPTPEIRTEYTHTGWRKLGDDWVYLHGDGAIRAGGLDRGVCVRLPGSLSSFVLPTPPVGAVLMLAVRAVLSLLGLAPARISYPLIGGVFRAVMCGTDYSIHLTGLTGAFKTELAALIQSFFGAGFTSRSLPAAWSSTANALEALAFVTKDALVVIDDFVPQGRANDVGHLNREADRVLRGQGNNAGRHRANVDGSIRPAKFPRGTILSTGEDVPAGHSLRSRMLTFEIEKGAIASEALTACQADAASGQYSAAMSAHLQWLAPAREGIEHRIRDRVQALRKSLVLATSTTHKRTPDIAAHLIIGFDSFLEFAVEKGVLTPAEASNLRERARAAIFEAAQAQAEIMAAADPVDRFISLLRSALSAGKGHVTGEGGHAPHGFEPVAVGWQPIAGVSGEWTPRGPRIGWLVNGDLFVDPAAALLAVHSMCDDIEGITITSRTLCKRLSERGWLVQEDKARGRHLVRRRIAGVRHDVLHLRLSLLLESTQSARRGDGRVPWAQDNDPGTESGDDNAQSNGESSPRSVPAAGAFAPAGPIGPGTHGVEPAEVTEVGSSVTPLSLADAASHEASMDADTAHERVWRDALGLQAEDPG